MRLKLKNASQHNHWCLANFFAGRHLQRPLWSHCLYVSPNWPTVPPGGVKTREWKIRTPLSPQTCSMRMWDLVGHIWQSGTRRRTSLTEEICPCLAQHHTLTNVKDSSICLISLFCSHSGLKSHSYRLWQGRFRKTWFLLWMQSSLWTKSSIPSPFICCTAYPRWLQVKTRRHHGLAASHSQSTYTNR